MVARILVGEKALKENFPQMPVGKRLEALFASSAEAMDQFAILVLAIDQLLERHEVLGKESCAAVLLRLAGILEGLSQDRTLTWGRIDQARFACICQETDEVEATELAKGLQRRFMLSGEQSLSVGLAVYPFWPFERASVLANAEKALEHAAFFGPGTVTPFDAVSLNISADKLYQYGDLEGAIAEFKKALMVDPDNVNVHNSLGVCYGVQGELDQAISAFETVMDLNPEDVMATYNLALAYLKQGNRDKALDLFLSAHSLDGNNPDIACHIGLCYQEMGQSDKALMYLETAVQKAPKRANVFRALADCYVHKGQLPDAAKAYEKAIKANPKDAKSLSALGHLYGTLGENLEVAIVMAEESITIDPDNGLYRKRLAELYLHSGQCEKAFEEFQKATALGQDCREALETTNRAIRNSDASFTS